MKKHIESLSAPKFAAITNEAMRFIVGGAACATGGGEDPKTCEKYSNDYKDDKGVRHVLTDGNNGGNGGKNDYTAATLEKRGVQGKCEM